MSIPCKGHKKIRDDQQQNCCNGGTHFFCEFCGKINDKIGEIRNFDFHVCHFRTDETMTEGNNYIFECRFKVRDYEMDAEGIVNNANYLHYLEMTRHEFCEWAGLSFMEMRNKGIDPVLNRVEIDYMVPLRGGDSVISKMSLSRRGARFIFVQDLFRESDGAQSVHAVVSCVAIENGRITRGDALAAVFAKFI